MIVASRLSLIAAVLFGLVSCALGPDLELTSRGRLPIEEPATFAVSRTEGDGPILQAASIAVGKALSARGWRAEAAAPQWQVEAFYAERPRSLGAFAEEDAPGEPEGWRISPMPRRWWRRDERAGVLALRIVDASTGAEVVEAEARSRIGNGASSVDLDRLAEVVVAEALAAGRQPSALSR